MDKDPYELKYDPVINIFDFRDIPLMLRFDGKWLYRLLCILRERLEDKNVCAFDLNDLPIRIFQNTPLSYNPGAAWLVYSIVETWVTALEDTLHEGKKKRLFDDFRIECKELLNASISTEQKVISFWINEDIFFKSYFEQEFIKILLGCSTSLTNDPKLIKNFIDGLALLPNYWRTFDKLTGDRLDLLTRPVFDLIIDHFKRAIAKEEAYSEYSAMFREFNNENKFKLGIITYPISRDELLVHMRNIKNVDLLSTEHKQILKDWGRYKKSFTIEQPNSDNAREHTSELTMELDELANLENKYWQGIPIKVFVSHFRVMTQKNSINRKPFLTTEALISFINRGFLNDRSQPKQKINYGRKEKGFVIKRFYELFDLAVNNYGHSNDTKVFVELITDCFENNWTPRSIIFLFKANKIKRMW